MKATDSYILRIEGLAKTYVQLRRFTRERYKVRAFENVNLSIPRGGTLAIVGESGAGKSSLARCLAMLEKPDEGEIRYEGSNIVRASRKDRFSLHRDIQYVFQEAMTAVNPRFNAVEVITEPLLLQRMGTKAEQRARALELMRQVGLSPDDAEKPALEFSGGQRQRLATARALAVQPKVLILDEALSNLDLPNQELILRILDDLQRRHALTYVHISHDLRAVSQFADEVAVMREGKIVEHKRTADLFAHPEHAYTRELLEAMPSVESILLQRSA